MIEGSTIVVTGGAGFIGTALTRQLAGKNKVRIVDIFRRNALADAGLDTHPNVQIVKADVCDAATMMANVCFDASVAVLAEIEAEDAHFIGAVDQYILYPRPGSR